MAITTRSTMTTTTIPADPLTHNSLVPAAAIASMRQDVSARTTEVVGLIHSIHIMDATDYADADLLLVRIRQSRKLAEKIFDEKIGGPVLEPMRLALASLYALRKEMTETPFLAAEATVKGKMAVWQREQDRIRAEERERAQREERERVRQADQQRRQAEEAERVAKAQTNAKAREEAEAVARRLRDEQAVADADALRATEVAKAAEKAKPMVGVGSRVTRKKKPVVVDMTAFLRAVLAGDVPEICVAVNEEVMKEYWEADRGLVSAWAGVEIVEEVKVGGR